MTDSIELQAEIYREHGLADRVVGQLRGMPRSHDCDLQAINAFNWVG